MDYMRLLLTILLTVGAATGAREDAHTLLAKALAAYERNQQQEVHWNWTAEETRSIVGKEGDEQKLADVTVESVIRDDGRRCNAVLAWADGTKPYALDSNPDSRCQATEAFRPPFDISELLKSRNVRFVSRPPKTTILDILPDKDRQRSVDPEAGCAASIRATVILDAATSFPRRMEGEVVGSGCAPTARVPVYYDRQGTMQTRRSFQKGARFQMIFELQPDRFQNPERSFWIRTFEHTDAPVGIATGGMVYWGRRFPITVYRPDRVVKEARTVAQEFGTESTVR